MSEIPSSSNAPESPKTADALVDVASGQTLPPTADVTATEHRQAYGTAKTENLRDSGAWRYLLPGFVILCCLAILAIPLIILIPLLSNSLSAGSTTHGIIWVWVTMIVIVLAAVTVISRGLLTIFLTQAGNY